MTTDQGPCQNCGRPFSEHKATLNPDDYQCPVEVYVEYV